MGGLLDWGLFSRKKKDEIGKKIVKYR